MSEQKAKYDAVNVIRFIADVAKLQTLADGGIRVTLDLPEDAVEQMAQLANVKRGGAVLEIAAVPVYMASAEDNGRKPHTRATY